VIPFKLNNKCIFGVYRVEHYLYIHRYGGIVGDDETIGTEISADSASGLNPPGILGPVDKSYPLCVSGVPVFQYIYKYSTPTGTVYEY
jgi:hypothetical protein